MAPPLSPTVYTGTFIHTPTLGAVEVLRNAAIGVNEHGVIVSIMQDLSPEDLKKGVVAEGEKSEGRWKVSDLGAVGEGKWWFPGFVDTHIHASQHPNAGIFGRTTLLTWLNKYTYPLESSFSDLPTAHRTYSRCVTRTLSNGTTTAAYFATTHVAATNLLADICLAKGQRAFVGRVCMDSDLSPSYYRDTSPSQAMKDTEATIKHMLEIDPAREVICPIVTPRFAPSCSSVLLKELGALAKRESLPIQTHISENPSECELVRSLFPAYEHYAGVYDAHGLLTPRTVLAHAIHLLRAERRLLKDRGCAVSHCPVSNTSLSSGLCPVRELLDEGIPVGLGTDVSGGYSSSILVAAREAGMVSRIRAALHQNEDAKEAASLAKGGTIAADIVGGLMDKIGLEKQEDTGVEVGKDDADGPATGGGNPPVSSPADRAGDSETADLSKDNADRKKLTVEECLYLATMGGAKCLGLDHKIGSFAVGKQWDAQLIEVEVIPEAEAEVDGKGANDSGDAAQEMNAKLENAGGEREADLGLVELWGKESWEEKLAKWVVCGDDRNTRYVFVGGRMVHRRR